jgi:hypothetical protein
LGRLQDLSEHAVGVAKPEAENHEVNEKTSGGYRDLGPATRDPVHELTQMQGGESDVVA